VGEYRPGIPGTPYLSFWLVTDLRENHVNGSFFPGHFPPFVISEDGKNPLEDFPSVPMKMRHRTLEKLV
jgi:hypothetical protein